MSHESKIHTTSKTSPKEDEGQEPVWWNRY